MATDYADSAVPDGATVHGLQIAMVITGIGATLPMFTLGTQIAAAQGLRMAVGISLLACGMVGVVAVFASIAGACFSCSSVAFTFGNGRARKTGTIGGGRFMRAKVL